VDLRMRFFGGIGLTISAIYVVRWLVAALALGFPLFLAAQDGPGNPVKGDATALEKGRVLFRIHCASCHGIDGSGGRGPSLTTSSVREAKDKELFAIIRRGIPDSEMPSFWFKGQDIQAWQVIEALRSLSPTSEIPSAGNAESGKQAFVQAGCVTCHAVQGQGGRLGPDLTRVSRSRSVEHLRQSIRLASAELTTNYQTVTVKTLANQTVRGILLNEDAFTLQMMDTTERVLAFHRKDLQQARHDAASLMPDYPREALPDALLDDIVAFFFEIGSH